MTSISDAVRNLEEDNVILRSRIAFLERSAEEAGYVPARELPPSGLTNIQFKLLRLLLSREVVASESIMASLYNGKVRGDSVIKVHISRLRQWLKPHGIEIKTRWGMGYYISREHRAAASTLPGLSGGSLK